MYCIGDSEKTSQQEGEEGNESNISCEKENIKIGNRR